MKITFKQLEELITRLCGGNTKLIEAAGCPRAAEITAANLFVEQVMETDDTKMLRHQLKHLWHNSKFDLIED